MNGTCSATVVVIVSPYLSITFAVQPRLVMDNNAWLFDPWGDLQSKAHDDSIKEAQRILEDTLKLVGGSLKNGFNGLLPYRATSVTIVAPAANPDYEQEGAYSQNPWYAFPTELEKDALLFRRQAYLLRQMAVALVIPGRTNGGSNLLTYRARNCDDPAQKLDNRQYISLEPISLPNGQVSNRLRYDGDQVFTVSQVSTR